MSPTLTPPAIAGREIFFHACSAPKSWFRARVYVRVRNILNRNKGGKNWIIGLYDQAGCVYITYTIHRMVPPLSPPLPLPEGPTIPLSSHNPAQAHACVNASFWKEKNQARI